MSYRLFTDATADLTPELMEGLPEVTVLPMDITLDGRSFVCGPGGITPAAFYAAQRAGKFASTSQIRPAVYLDAFEDCLRSGADVLYLCFSSGMSATCQTAQLCAAELRERYPQRRVLCLDTLCASVGAGSGAPSGGGLHAGRTGRLGAGIAQQGLPLVHGGHL